MKNFFHHIGHSGRIALALIGTVYVLFVLSPNLINADNDFEPVIGVFIILTSLLIMGHAIFDIAKGIYKAVKDQTNED